MTAYKKKYKCVNIAEKEKYKGNKSIHVIGVN